MSGNIACPNDLKKFFTRDDREAKIVYLKNKVLLIFPKKGIPKKAINRLIGNDSNIKICKRKGKKTIEIHFKNFPSEKIWLESYQKMHDAVCKIMGWKHSLSWYSEWWKDVIICETVRNSMNPLYWAQENNRNRKLGCR